MTRDPDTSERFCIRCGYSLAGLSTENVCPECEAPLWWSEEPNWRMLALVDSYRRVVLGWRLLAAAVVLEMGVLLPMATTMAQAARRSAMPLWAGVIGAAVISRVAGAWMLSVDAWKQENEGTAMGVLILGLGRAAALVSMTQAGVPGASSMLDFAAAAGVIWLDHGVQAAVMYRAGRSLDEMWHGLLNATVIVVLITGGLGLVASLPCLLLGSVGAFVLSFVVSSSMLGLCYLIAAQTLMREHPTAQARRGELG